MNEKEKEIITKKYRYRKLLLQHKLKLPIKTAQKIIGPDCAYHLYSGHSGLKKESTETNQKKE
ncbi:MAG: hypothetical protein MJB14_13155 [Spirochaetes bacterium]|nr:hypothetical protein [Spirochaetota bacterium]